MLRISGYALALARAKVEAYTLLRPQISRKFEVFKRLETNIEVF